jgi:hypothetical protein
VNFHISELEKHAEHCPKRLTGDGTSGVRILNGSDFTNCPNCGIRVLSSNIEEHLETGCKNRKVKDFTMPEYGSGFTPQSWWTPDV